MGRPPKMYLVRVVIDIDRRPAEVLEGLAVKITYDRRTDTLSVVLKEESPSRRATRTSPA